MAMKDSGGPAYPTIDYDLHGNASTMKGMTKRDWFAAQALVGLLANAVTSTRKHEAVAANAYAYADAMIAESKRKDED